MSDALWYKDAIIYQLHVKAFFDSTDDGIGDFAGLASKLDYLQNLGVTALWLLPFYPSPLRDDGYDIADYRGVHPAYGRIRDFRRFVRAAHARGLKVITELVVNHTSDQHRWFQRARQSPPGSAHRDFYVWSDTDQRYQDTRIIFTDTETSNWAWDPVANAYYWHRFFSHQPDLNFANPRVLKAVIGAMNFWLDMGVDGLRLDAIPYLCEREGTNNENLAETHAVVRKIRASLDGRYEDRMLLAEANQWPEDVLPYFGDGQECHMAFHFPLMPRIYMAVAQEDRHPITDIMRQTPDIPDTCQWAVFLRNHDELTLEMVSDRERDQLWNFYANDPRMRINLGIRRRLAPLLENDRQKIELLNSLLMSMPGTPIIYYGDEIGMGDNIYLGDRDAVRTPMQWSPDRNAGFSKADPARLYLPPIMNPIYGYEAVNVEAQSRSASSLLSWMKRLIAVRKSSQAFGRGTLTFLYPGNRKVLAYYRQYEDDTILCIANLSRAAQPCELNLAEFKGRVPVEMIGQSAFPPIGELPYFITLPGHSFYWFYLATEVEAPSWHETLSAPLPELITLVAPEGLPSVMAGRPRNALEARVLPDFLPQQRWFGAKDLKIAAIKLESHGALADGRAELAIFDVTFTNRTTRRYFVPLSAAWETRSEDPLSHLLPFTLARVRRGARIGILFDAVADDDFARGMAAAIAAAGALEMSDGGRIRFVAGEAASPPGDAEVRRIGQEQSNSSLMIGEDRILKLYRAVEVGIHPEVEIGRYLTEQAGYANAPALLGALVHEDASGRETWLGVMHAAVRNQGDGWRYTLDHLGRILEEADLLSAEAVAQFEDPHVHYTAFAETLGRRTAELHRAFARPTDDPRFRPEPVGEKDVEGWKRAALRQAEGAFRAVRRMRKDLPEAGQRFLAVQKAVEQRIRRALRRGVDAAKTRLHGDFHLGQVLVAGTDIYIIDFEGEPARPLRTRGAKQSPLKDVAGMLRSFDYAAWSGIVDRASIRPEFADRVTVVAAEWKRQAVDAFLSGYREAIGDAVSWPRDPRTVQELVDLFTLEKALYEVRYEAANRPDWVRIPIEGVLALMSADE